MAQLCGVYDFYNQFWFVDVQDVYVISDTHFNERDLQIAFPQRPKDEDLIKRINSKCGRSSALIHLGDVGDISYIPQLRAKMKILIQGNHDRGVENYKRVRLTEEYDANIYTKETVLSITKEKYPNWEYHIYRTSEKWVLNVDNKMFDYVFQGPVILGEKLILSHEPIFFSSSCGQMPLFNIHGHVHSTNKYYNDEGCYHKNVCCDVCDYTPFHLNSFLKDGGLSYVQTIHRQTIDRATERKRK